MILLCFYQKTAFAMSISYSSSDVCSSVLLHALVERDCKAVFFGTDGHSVQLTLVVQLGIRAAHDFGQRRNQLVEERAVQAELVPVADRTTHDATQDIAATLIRRHHAIRDQEAGRATVIGTQVLQGVRVRP